MNKLRLIALMLVFSASLAAGSTFYLFRIGRADEGYRFEVIRAHAPDGGDALALNRALERTGGAGLFPPEREEGSFKLDGGHVIRWSKESFPVAPGDFELKRTRETPKRQLELKGNLKLEKGVFTLRYQYRQDAGGKVTELAGTAALRPEHPVLIGGVAD